MTAQAWSAKNGPETAANEGARASDAPERSAAELRANAQACRELAAEFRALVAAIDAGRLVGGGPRQRLRVSRSADGFDRQADDDLELADLLDPRGTSAWASATYCAG